MKLHLATIITDFDDGFSDYALARIEFSPVPVTAAVWLFASALPGLIGLRRRKQPA